MRSVSSASSSSGSGLAHLRMGARRQKTDLQVAEPAAVRSSSPAPSLRSQRAKQYRASLPVRTARLLQRSRTQTPSDAGISDGSASPAPASVSAPAPASLLQDVVDIKTLLLQLKRVLQEPGEEHHSMSSETLDPLLAACAESPARGNGRRPPASPLHPDASAEMRRQILYLQGQLEERDRLVRVLQQQMLRMAEGHEPRVDDTCNVATQTDRPRLLECSNIIYKHNFYNNVSRSRIMSTTQKKSIRNVIVEEIYTCCAFWFAVSALPALAVSYVVVRISKHLWLKLLSSRYPHLEFIRTDTVRSLLDTHRNQGIINVLLSVKDTLNTDQIRDRLMEHVINKRDKNGDLMFPRLRHSLVSCWGNYAWDANSPFRTENHFIVANTVYRGRQVNESNIQEFVSEIVSKYFPPDQPPWQYIIIPCVATEPRYYILVRVHHLLLTGKKSLNIGDLLMVEQNNPTDTVTDQETTHTTSPLTRLFPTTSALPELWGKLNESMSNTWNEFVSEYDPLESPRALKTLPGAFHVAGLILISSINAIRVLIKRNGRDSRPTEPITALTFLAAIQRECKRRNLTIMKIIVSPLITADPRKWPRRTFDTFITSTRMFFKFPFLLRDELVALIELKNYGHAKHPNTMTWKYGELAYICARATGETWRGLVEIYKAPSKLWTDTIRADDGKRHVLQTVSLCGRKVVCWSRPVSRAGLERVARALGVSCTDIALYAATDALRAFYEHSHANPPESILTTARAASEDFLFTFAEGQGKIYKKSQTGGMVCLALPVGGTPRRIASVVEQACNRQRALAAAWAAQARCGALTRALPSPLARLSLNVLSRRYAVSYAEINSPVDAKPRTTLWGQTVDFVVYWRPPQANISMSLTVIQYADTVRISVMTDARLSPAHIVPSTRWPTAIEQLVSKVDQEIARIATQTHPPARISETVTTQELAHVVTAGEISPNEEEKFERASTLKPPTLMTVSPPPLRRRFTDI